MRSPVRNALLLAVVSAPACYAGAEIEFTCNVVDERPVDDDAAPLGFTVTEMVDVVDGRAWDVEWVGDDEGEPAVAFALADVRATVTRTALPASVRETTAGASDCPTAGLSLAAPVDVRLADGDGTFVATTRTHAVATALDDAAIFPVTDEHRLSIEALPDDIAEAAEAAALDFQPTTIRHDVRTWLSGPAAALELSFDVAGEGPDGSYSLALSTAALTPR